MNIDSANLSKSNRLSVTVSLSGAELAWLQHLAQRELDRGETLGFGLGNQLLTASELRSMTERLDPTYVMLCVEAKRQKWNLDADQLLQIVKKKKAAANV